MLRLPAAASPLDDLCHGQFQPVLSDKAENVDAERILLCSGKIVHELRAYREKTGDTSTAILALEQFYPFPQESFQEELAKYPKATEVVWCQEEPRNQGAWYWIASRQHLSRSLSEKQHLLLVSRPASASPAVGYQSKHIAQQKALIDSAFGEIEYFKLP